MRFPAWQMIAAAVIVLAVLLGVGALVFRPPSALLTNAEFGLEVLSPNADGVDDITEISYRLSEPATVSIYFLDEAGERYDFRVARPRSSGEHRVLFSGIVAGYDLPDDEVEGEIVDRVLQDGSYTWVIEARTDQAQAELRGDLTIIDADTTLPDLRGFSVYPLVFTPNRDGIDDRTTINVYVARDATLRVTLVGEDGGQTPIPEAASSAAPGTAGLHTFDYEGGVDQGAQPPDDGDYTVVALAEDVLGQKVRASGTLTIANGGIPRAEIVNATVTYNESTLLQGDVLTFELTVENYGTAPIRTTGPAPGTVFDYSENSNTLGWYDESGAWRIGIDCDTCIRDYPYRWALGSVDELTKIGEHYYLMPGQRVVLSGGIRLSELPARNPLYFWAGLIHEDVEISNVNNRVDPHLVTIEAP